MKIPYGTKATVCIEKTVPWRQETLAGLAAPNPTNVVDIGSPVLPNQQLFATSDLVRPKL